MQRFSQQWQTAVWGLTVMFLSLMGGIVLAQSDAALLETYWRVVEIDRQPVPVITKGREPHLILKADSHRVQGATGCNRFTGAYVQNRDSLRFKPLATTRMACPPPADALEQSFLQALGATSRWRVTGNTLELRDDQGNVRMRLQAQL